MSRRHFSLVALLTLLHAAFLYAADPVPWGPCKPVKEMAHPKLVGTIDGHRIYDSVEYRGSHLITAKERFDSPKPLPEQIWTKRIFVERNPDEFCQIYLWSSKNPYKDFQDGLLQYAPSHIRLAAGRPVIETYCPMADNSFFAEESYFILRADGAAVELPVDPLVRRAVRQLKIPKPYFLDPAPGFNVRALTFSQNFRSDKDAHCCPSGGTVTINFKLVGDDLQIKSRRYVPAPKN